jgi:hypothetical protein
MELSVSCSLFVGRVETVFVNATVLFMSCAILSLLAFGHSKLRKQIERLLSVRLEWETM